MMTSGDLAAFSRPTINQTNLIYPKNIALINIKKNNNNNNKKKALV